jgi:putative transposase
VSRPGDLVQVDTLEVRPLPGVSLKQFTARDLISKWDVVKAIQVDGGSEFYSEFERECERRGGQIVCLTS